MSKFTLTVIVAAAVLSTGCIARAEIDTLHQQNELLKRQNDALRASLEAKSEEKSEDEEDKKKESDETPSDDPGTTEPAPGQDGAVAASEVVRGEKQAYLCVTGSQPRQVQKGRKLLLVNNYCDGDRDGGLGCADNDNDGFPDNDSLMGLEIDGKPVVTDTQGVLKPNQACYVDVGRSRRVSLTVMRFANLGTHRAPKIDPLTVDASYTQTVQVEGNVTLHDITENKHWSSR